MAVGFFAERCYSLPIEYFDSIKGRLSDSYSVIGQVGMLFEEESIENIVWETTKAIQG